MNAEQAAAPTEVPAKTYEGKVEFRERIQNEIKALQESTRLAQLKYDNLHASIETIKKAQSSKKLKQKIKDYNNNAQGESEIKRYKIKIF